MTVKDKKTIQSIIYEMIAALNADETYMVEYITCKRVSAIKRLKDYDLLLVLKYLSDYERCNPVRNKMFEMLLQVPEYQVIIGGQLMVDLTAFNQLLKDNGFSCEFYALNYEELLKAHSLVTLLYDDFAYNLSFTATKNVLKELGIPVITTPRKKKNNETSNKRTAK